MAKEIEIKVLKIDIEKIEEKIISIGGKLLSIEEQKNILFDTESNFKNRNIDGYLRIRETKDIMNNEIKKEITFKENISREGMRENREIETDIKDIDSMINILEKLGYDLLSIGYKKRKSYIYKDIRFDIDIWDKETYPYPYMEIEVKKHSDLDKAIELLDLDKNNITTKSILELRLDLENK